MCKKNHVPRALYCTVGDYVRLETLSEEQEEKIIRRAMESLAIQTLEQIYQVLENDDYDDPECFERVDALVMLFFKELGININRHSELD